MPVLVSTAVLPCDSPLTTGSGTETWNMDGALASLPPMFSHRFLLPGESKHMDTCACA